MFIDPFQEKIWQDKYQYKGETYEQFCHRVADNIFPDDKERNGLLFNFLMEFRGLFGGRVNSNIGVDEQGLTLFNCFIECVSKNPDSLEGIMDMVTKYALTLKTEGGVGFCANFLRPSKTLIKKIGVTTPGAIKFLEIFDKTSEVITSGSVDKDDSYQGVPSKKSIRKGATMVTMSINHPDIEEFITAKSIPNRLTKMNMSVLITDAFMYAVENNMDWDLWFPDINYENYDNEWDGNFETWAEKGYPFVIYKTIKATELWDLLLKNTYNRNEPGILFVNNARRMDNLHYLDGGSITSTNPCVVGSTLVPTDNGLFPAKDIVENQVLQTTLGFGKAKEIKKYENEEIYRVFFYDGFYQDVTKGHIFHSMINDQESRKTWSNTERLFNLDAGSFVRKEWYKKFPEYNKKLNRDVGLLIGLYLGDGSFSNYQCFNISTNSKEDNAFIEELYSRLGGSCRIDESEGHCVRYYFTNNSKALKSLFMELGINPNGKVFDPLKLLNTNEGFIKGIIDGLISSDGDVNLKGRYPQIRFSNSNFNLHILMKHLMLFVKADYKVYNSKKSGEISKIYGRKVTRKKDCPTGVIDNDSILNLYNELGYLSNKNKNQLLLETIKTKQLNGVKWKTRIKSIEYIGRDTVYDLYEPKSDDWNHEGYVSRGCGEVFGNTGNIVYNMQELALGDVCDLGSINLTKYYTIEDNKFCVEDLREDVDLMVRALDNIIDVSNYPLPMYENAAKLKRKIGLGLMGVGSLMMMMGIRYGSEECVDILESILSETINHAYKTSAIMAKEKGPFPLWDKKALDGGFLKHSGVLRPEVIKLIEENGLRNSALMAIAPNGSLSIVAGNISGGLEPVFDTEFSRWNRVEGKKVDFEHPNIHKGEWFETDYLKEQQVADEVILLSKDNEYRIDKNNGLCKKVTISDYGYNIAKAHGRTEFTTAKELSVAEHLGVLKVFAKYIDQSCSKTINLPNDIAFEDFKELYGSLHSYGVKGCTTYREGTSVAILETEKKETQKSIKKQQKEFLAHFKDQENGDIIATEVKLPEQYPAQGYVLRSEGKKWYLHVAFKDKACTRPFAVFVNTNNKEDNTVTYNALEKMEEIALSKGLNGSYIEETKRKYAYQKNPVKICRMIGLLLRHNVDVYDIIRGFDELAGATPGTFVFRMKKFLAQFVRSISEPEICPDCKEKALIFSQGCFSCQQCGHSKCS